MIGWLRQAAWQLLAALPDEARARVMSVLSRLSEAPGLVTRLISLAGSFKVTPELLSTLRDLGRRVLEDPRVALELVDQLEPVWAATLTWLESREVTEAQLEAVLSRVSQRLVGLWGHEPGWYDGERLLTLFEELASTWLETLADHLAPGRGAVDGEDSGID